MKSQLLIRCVSVHISAIIFRERSGSNILSIQFEWYNWGFSWSANKIIVDIA